LQRYGADDRHSARGPDVWSAAGSSALLLERFLTDVLFQTDWLAADQGRPDGWLLPLPADPGEHDATTAALLLLSAPAFARHGRGDLS
jgi:hypothetical protein